MFKPFFFNFYGHWGRISLTSLCNTTITFGCSSITPYRLRCIDIVVIKTTENDTLLIISSFHRAEDADPY